MTDPTAVSASVAPIEQFAALRDSACRHGFVGRVPGLDVSTDRAQALVRLDEFHRGARLALGLATRTFVTAEQAHGDGIAVVFARRRCLRRSDARRRWLRHESA